MLELSIKSYGNAVRRPRRGGELRSDFAAASHQARASVPADLLSPLRSRNGFERSRSSIVAAGLSVCLASKR